MAEPAWKIPLVAGDEVAADEEDAGLSDEPEGGSVLQRWVFHPDGRAELVELPLTPELFLDPQLEDKMVQGWLHIRTVLDLFELLSRHFRVEPDLIVLCDMKHLLGPGLPGPAPDISIVRGARHPNPDLASFDLIRQGVAPCLVIEVISPRDARLRRADEVDKVALYQRVGIQEYLLIDLPRRQQPLRIKGYRLDAAGRYAPLDPEEDGFLPSTTTGLRFGVSPSGDQIEILVAATGERLLRPIEEVEARQAAEEEIARLRAEIERLKR
jgi:Uma2 family endonuclease